MGDKRLTAFGKLIRGYAKTCLEKKALPQSITLITTAVLTLLLSLAQLAPIQQAALNSESVEHLEGDLIVDGGVTQTIEGKQLYIKGNLIVKDGSTLIVKNSTIVLELRFFGEYWAEVRDGSQLIVENSTLERTDGHNTLFVVNPGCRVVLRNVFSGWDIAPNGGEILLENYDASSARNGIFFSSGQIVAKNSKFNIISVVVASEERKCVELEGLSPGYVDHLVITRGSDKRLELISSEVDKWVVDVGFPNKPSHADVVVKDSKLWGLWIWFNPESEVVIKDIQPGTFTHWRMSEAWKVEGMGYDIELINTSVDMFKLQIVGKAVVERVSGVQVAPRGSSYVYVKDSVIEVNLILRGNEHVVLENTEVRASMIELIQDRSSIQYVIGRGGTHYLEFRNAVVKVPFEIGCDYAFITGDVTIEPGVGVIWACGVVDREFSVEVCDVFGNPIGGAYVEVLDSGGNVVWSGWTDEGGRAKFTIRFTEKNYEDTWVLRVEAGGESSSTGFGFLSSTPIRARVLLPLPLIVFIAHWKWYAVAIALTALAGVGILVWRRLRKRE